MDLKKRLALILTFTFLLLNVLPVCVSYANSSEPTSALQTEEEQPPAQSVPTDEPSNEEEPQADSVFWSADSDKPLTIRIREDASESETEAARLLKSYLSQATGAVPEILTGISSEKTEENGGAFVLALTDGDAKTGSYTVKLGADGDLHIEANDARGLINGVYAFLRKFCGVSLYSTSVKSVGKVSDLVIPAGYEKTYTPALEYADTDWLSPHDVDFALANGLNGTYSPIPAMMGGHVKYITFCHSLTTSIVPESELLSSHPEYYALQENGERTADQLCLSNPEVVERATQDVLRLINENYDETAPLNIISVTQDDNQRYCTCENCTAIADQYGGQSGLMLWFVNQIADAVAASDHPDVVVDTFAYQYTRKAPVGIVPRENVCVRLCSIECCFAHSLDDSACEENAAFTQDLRDWAKISNRLYIWDYTTNYSQTLGIFPDFGVLQKNIQTFVQNNVVGIYEEGAYYAGDCNTEFADLRAYLLARFLQDPDEADPEGLRDGFLSAYYGQGATEIGAFLDFITAHAGDEDGHLSIGEPMRTTLHGVSAEDIEKMDGLWDTAYEKAFTAGNTAAADRIERSRVSWEYYKACAKVGEYKRGINIFRWIGANKALSDKLDELGVTRYNEWNTFEKLKRSSVLSPDEWGDLSGAGYVLCVCAIVAALILCIAAAVVCFRKYKIALLMPVFAAVLIPMGLIARDLFRAWENVLLYFLLTVVMNLIVGIFALYAAWAMGGFAKMSVKKAVLSYGIGALIALATYHVCVYLVNNVMFTGNEPGYAICFAFSWSALLIIADVVTVLICRKRAKKKTECITINDKNSIGEK